MDFFTVRMGVQLVRYTVGRNTVHYSLRACLDKLMSTPTNQRTNVVFVK